MCNAAGEETDTGHTGYYYVNETQVERQEQLSDKVQFCDGKTAVMKVED